jgi:hypothetical protein
MEPIINKSLVKKHKDAITTILNELKKEEDAKNQKLLEIKISEKKIKEIAEIYLQHKFFLPGGGWRGSLATSVNVALTKKQYKNQGKAIFNHISSQKDMLSFTTQNNNVKLKSKNSSVNVLISSVESNEKENKMNITVIPIDSYCCKKDNGTYKFSK